LAPYQRSHLKIITFHEPHLLGTAGTILANRHWVQNGDPFFILYADNLTNINLSKFLRFHLEQQQIVTLGVFRAANPKQCGIAEVTPDGLVTGFEEKPEVPKSNLAGAGMYVTDSRIFEFFPPLDTAGGSGVLQPLDLGFHVLPRLAGRMKAYFIEDFLMDIGTPQQYKNAQILLNREQL
jgi:mannose-1-phosphate guanylyltransferase